VSREHDGKESSRTRDARYPGRTKGVWFDFVETRSSGKAVTKAKTGDVLTEQSTA